MWAVYASLASIAIGLYYLGNQAAKVSSTVFMVYRGVMPILFLLPVLPFVSLPAAWPFYVVCLVQGGVISFVDMRNFRAMRVWGAETISSIHPFCVGIVFFVWLLLNPGGLIAYGREPLRFLTVAAALGTVIFSVSGYRGDRRGRKALRYMVPYLLFCAACDTLNKTAMSFLRPHELVSGSCLYILITAVVICIVNFSFYFRGGGKLKALWERQNVKCALVMVPLVLSMVFKNFAMFATPNPSYVTATMYLYVIWVFAAGAVLRFFGRNIPALRISLRRVLLLLAAVVVLILFGR